jgi:hypothetical protein
MLRFKRGRSIAWVIVLGAAAAALLRTTTSAQAPGGGGVVRTDISGDWVPAINEDQPHRAPGPELGDYTGLPLNDADRQKAISWDATILSQPERQSQAHPAQYWMRGPQPPLRILKILDPVTQTQVAYTLAGGFGRADRVVWMDGRPHPSDYSEHTWDGFSTGVWDNGQLVVTTTHMKQGVIQRNGSATSPYGVMTEHWFRHGTMMTMFWSVDDPIFLEEPMVRTHNWAWNPNGNMGFGNPFESVDELGDKPLGWVPAFPLGTKHTEFAEAHNLPYKATLGGKDNTYPEYMDKIKQYAQEEAAEKAKAEAEKAAGTKKAPAKK